MWEYFFIFLINSFIFICCQYLFYLLKFVLFVIKEIKVLLQQRMGENKGLKQAKLTSKQSYDMKNKRMEAQRRQLEETKRKQKEQEGVGLNNIIPITF